MIALSLKLLSGIAGLTVIPAIACVWRAFCWLMVPNDDGFEMPAKLIFTRAAMLAVAAGFWAAWMEAGREWPHVVMAAIAGGAVGATGAV